MLTLLSGASGSPAVESSSQTVARISRSGAAGYAIAVGVTVLLFVPLLHLHRADLRVPFIYNHDGLATLALVQNIHDNIDYFHNPRLGYPYEQDYRAFPSSDGWLHYGLLKFFGVFGADAALATNLFFLLGFPLTTVTSLWALRRFGLSDPVAIGMALLYAYAPYHVFRNLHLFLVSYFLWPPTAWFIVQVYRGEFSWRGGAGTNLARALFLFAMGMGGAYYAMFASFCFALAAVAAAWRRCEWRLLLSGGAAIAPIALGLAITIAPSSLYKKSNPKNPESTQRNAEEAEYYGLKIVQLFLPIRDHRARVLREFRMKYDRAAPLNTENFLSSMGLVASAGLLLALARLALRRGDDPLWDGLALFSVSTILLCTIGGFSSLIAYGGFPLRAYNRFSICLQFFALTAVGLLLTKAHVWLVGRGRARIAGGTALAALVAAGLWDTAPNPFPIDYRESKIAYDHDRKFFQDLEATLGADCSLFPMPNLPYPEHWEGVYDTYELLKPHIHMKNLRYCYGAFRGHEGDEWVRRLVAMPLPRRVEELALAGITAIYLDRLGLPEKSKKLERELDELIPKPPIVSANERFVVYDLRPVTARLHAQSSPESWEARQRQVLYPVLVLYRGSFSFPIGDGQGKLSRVFADGELHLVNSLAQERTVRLSFTIVPAEKSENRRLAISGFLNETHHIEGQELRVERVISVPPGRHIVRLDFEEKMPLATIKDVTCEDIER